MKEREHRCVAVVEKHTLDGANTITLMKHMHKGHRHDWRHYVPTLHCTVIGFALDWESHKSGVANLSSIGID